MAIGTALSIESWLLTLVLSVIFATVYHYIILDEETKLRAVFSNSYDIYLASVPRLIPTLAPAGRETLLKINPNVSMHGFSLELALKNRAYEAYASFAGLIGFVALVAYIRNLWL